MSLKFYEIARRSLEPFLPPLYKQVRKRLIHETAKGDCFSVLDVGGRKSPYTIGVPARITIIDLPRETEVQNSLNLGINETIVDQLRQRRSNINDLVLGDMTKSDLSNESFDLVVSVEVLEHVEMDEKFVSEVCRVLKRGGKFIMTTPNGDYVENHNRDHKRHYKRAELVSLLSKYFQTVNVEYAIAGGYYRKLGLRSWSVRHPVQTFLSAFGNLVNSAQSYSSGIKTRAIGTHHLVAIAEKTG